MPGCFWKPKIWKLLKSTKDVYKKSATHNSSLPTLQKAIQATDVEECVKPANQSGINRFGAVGNSNYEHRLKKALDVCKKSPTHNLSFPTIQKVVQVADVEECKKHDKTYLGSIISIFLEAQNLKIVKKH